MIEMHGVRLVLYNSIFLRVYASRRRFSDVAVYQ